MSGLDDRMQGEPKVRDATIDELAQVYGIDGVQRMYEADALSPAQARAWLAYLDLPKAPPFGAPVPE